MINFIICDDQAKYLKITKEIITKYMMKNHFEYEVHAFNDYNKEFMQVVDSKMPSKIYILDIETPTRSGIDVARIIRNKDVNSVIIFLTGHQELGSVVIENEFLFLSFINKFVDCEKRLCIALDKALKVLDARKTIRFKDSSVVYTIALEDILYVTKDSVSRKCIVKTDYAEFSVGKNLSEIEGMLDDNFVKTHRACIVNKRRVVGFSKSKRLIMFDTGETTDIVSSRFEGELV